MNYDILTRRKGSSPSPVTKPKVTVPAAPLHTPKPANRKEAIGSVQDTQKLLEGYVVVPRELWNRLSRGDHIRYIRKSGKFCRGSFIKCIWKRDGKQFFQLETSIGGREMDPGYVTFPVAFEDITTVYRKLRSNNNSIARLVLHKIDRLERSIKTVA